MGISFFNYVMLFYAHFSGTQTGCKRRTWCNAHKYNSSTQNLKEKFAPVENRTPVVHPVGSNLPQLMKYLEIIAVVWKMKSRDGERPVSQPQGAYTTGGPFCVRYHIKVLSDNGEFFHVQIP